MMRRTVLPSLHNAPLCMKTPIKNLFLYTLITGLGLVTAGRLTAQTITTLYSFTATFPYVTNSDGISPAGGVIFLDGTLYGTAAGGGSSARGTVFAVSADGTAFTNLHNFPETFGPDPSTNSEGASPTSGLILLGNTLYGTAPNGGTGGVGTVFTINTDGTGYTNLHIFSAIDGVGGTNADGAYPYAGVISVGNALYGMAAGGGILGVGTVFKVNTDGTGFTNLHNFTISDGANPSARLLFSGNTLYGTAAGGGANGNGTVFKINTDGTEFTNLYSFSTTFPFGTNNDGASPFSGLILSSDTLYGTATVGGLAGVGTVFALNTDGIGFTNLHSFTAFDPNNRTNSDGANPTAGLVLSGNTLYGTARTGGTNGYGTLFAVKTDGTGFQTLHSFAVSSGVFPEATLTLSGNKLYGTAAGGGANGNGTVFSLALPPPQLTLIPAGANVILTWPTHAVGFTLQSTTNLGASAVWTTNSPGPVVVNGQNTVTNPISGLRKFYRLNQ